MVFALPYLAIGAWAVLDKAERNSDSVVPPSDLLKLAGKDEGAGLG